MPIPLPLHLASCVLASFGHVAPFGRALTSFSFSDAFIVHALFTLALFSLTSPLTEPVGAGEAKQN